MARALPCPCGDVHKRTGLRLVLRLDEREPLYTMRRPQAVDWVLACVLVATLVHGVQSKDDAAPGGSATPSGGDSAATAGISFGMIVMNLLGGVVVFLNGIKAMSGGLKAVLGDRLKRILAAACTNRFTAFCVGALVTAILSSSNATSALVIGFVATGDMSLRDGIAMGLGINVGVTATGHLVAFKVSKYALGIVVAGFAWRARAKDKRGEHVGDTIQGLGMLLFGISLIGNAMNPLKSHGPFKEAIAGIDSPILMTVASAVFTFLCQSNNATTAITISLADGGLVDMAGALALNVGGNVGSSFQGIVAAIGKGKAAMRMAVAYSAFRLVAAGIALVAYPVYVGAVRAVTVWLLSDGAAETQIASRGVANGHTIFNVGAALIFLPLVDKLADVVTGLLPEGKAPPSPKKPARSGSAKDSRNDTTNGVRRRPRRSSSRAG